MQPTLILCSAPRAETIDFRRLDYLREVYAINPRVPLRWIDTCIEDCFGAATCAELYSIWESNLIAA